MQFFIQFGCWTRNCSVFSLIDDECTYVSLRSFTLLWARLFPLCCSDAFYTSQKVVWYFCFYKTWQVSLRQVNQRGNLVSKSSLTGTPSSWPETSRVHLLCIIISKTAFFTTLKRQAQPPCEWVCMSAIGWIQPMLRSACSFRCHGYKQLLLILWGIKKRWQTLSTSQKTTADTNLAGCFIIKWP